MRYYCLLAENMKSGGFFRFSSYPDKILFNSPFVWGMPDYSALDIEFDFQAYPSGADSSNSTSAIFTIHGVSLPFLKYASQMFKGSMIRFFGGMGEGFKNAHPEQSGLLFAGKCVYAIGNYISNDTSLQLFCAFGATPQEALAQDTEIDGGTSTFNLFLRPYPTLRDIFSQIEEMMDGVKVEARGALGYYGRPENGGIMDAPLDIKTETVFFSLMPQSVFSYITESLTKNLKFKDPILNSEVSTGGFDSNGVALTLSADGKTIIAQASFKNKGLNISTSAASFLVAKYLNYEDIVGQPTINGNKTYKITVSVVLRADLKLGDIIAFPVNIFSTLAPNNNWTALSSTGFDRYSLLDQGTFEIVEIRHTGRFRSPDCVSGWTTLLTLIPLIKSKK